MGTTHQAHAPHMGTHHTQTHVPALTSCTLLARLSSARPPTDQATTGPEACPGASTAAPAANTAHPPADVGSSYQLFVR